MSIKLINNTFALFKINNFPFQTILIWPYTTDKPIAHMASLGKLECGCPRLAITNEMYDPQSFPFLVTISMQKI